MSIMNQVKAYLDRCGSAGAGLHTISADLDLDLAQVLAALRALKEQGHVHRADAPPPWSRSHSHADTPDPADDPGCITPRPRAGQRRQDQ